MQTKVEILKIQIMSKKLSKLSLVNNEELLRGIYEAMENENGDSVKEAQEEKHVDTVNISESSSHADNLKITEDKDEAHVLSKIDLLKSLSGEKVGVEEETPKSKQKRFRFNIVAFFRSRYQESLRKRNLQRRREVLRSELSDITEEEQIGSSIYVPKRNSNCFSLCWKTEDS